MEPALSIRVITQLANSENEEYCTEVNFSSIKSLTVGWDKCVINLQPEVFLGITPIGEHLKLDIGLY